MDVQGFLTERRHCTKSLSFLKRHISACLNGARMLWPGPCPSLVSAHGESQKKMSDVPGCRDTTMGFLIKH